MVDGIAVGLTVGTVEGVVVLDGIAVGLTVGTAEGVSVTTDNLRLLLVKNSASSLE